MLEDINMNDKKCQKIYKIISIDYKERSISLRHKYNISVIPCRSACRWSWPEYSEKPTDRTQFTDSLYHILLYRVHLTNLSGDS